jgi:hypothetical protein
MPVTHKDPADWSNEDISRLIELAHEHRSEVGDGGNFKGDFYTLASSELETMRTKGGEKTPTARKANWQSVRPVSSLAGTLCSLPSSRNRFSSQIMGWWLAQLALASHMTVSLALPLHLESQMRHGIGWSR